MGLTPPLALRRRRWVGWLWDAICLREIATERDTSSHRKEVRGDHRGADLLRRSVRHCWTCGR